MTSAHPLFDPRSRFSRMRAAVAVEDKMSGYFVWLRDHRGGAEEPPPAAAGVEPPPARSPLAADAWAMSAAAVESLVVRVDRPGARLDAEVEVELRPAGAGGKRLELVLTLRDPADFPARPADCRAFLLEPAVWDRLVGTLPAPPAAADRAACAGRLLAPDTLARNLEAAQVLSAVPEAEGVVDDRGVAVLGRRAGDAAGPIPVPDDGAEFDRALRRLCVLVAIDRPAE